MCTVTIIPKGNNDFILTSNRDEAPNRAAWPPDLYTIKDTRLLFPKDKMSDGTWIGVSDKNRMVCVLNGGFVFHKHSPPYKRSRGLVATDFLIADDLISYVETYNFDNIEPFTLVISDWNDQLQFFELVWDGKMKHFVHLPLEARIWSSSTLYTKDMQDERKSWFNDFMSSNAQDAKMLLKFHKTAGGGNENYGVLMNRGVVKTTSITQITKQNQVVNMRYEALDENLVKTETFNLPESVNE